jgi:nucleotide-binding universal stress UspA family protein
VVVFTDESARGRGPLAEYFQQMIADEQRPVLIARPGLSVSGVAVVAWDGGKEASRAARLATPLLKRASRVVILSAPKATSRAFNPAQLQAYYAARGLVADVEVLDDTGDVAPALLAVAGRLGAEILIAGAYGHTRLKEFILGGATRTLLNAEHPSLFLSH